MRKRRKEEKFNSFADDYLTDRIKIDVLIQNEIKVKQFLSFSHEFKLEQNVSQNYVSRIIH